MLVFRATGSATWSTPGRCRSCPSRRSSGARAGGRRQGEAVPTPDQRGTVPSAAVRRPTRSSSATCSRPSATRSRSTATTPGRPAAGRVGPGSGLQPRGLRPARRTRPRPKAAGLTLDPPTTWTRLDAPRPVLPGRDWDGDGPTITASRWRWGPTPRGSATRSSWPGRRRPGPAPRPLLAAVRFRHDGAPRREPAVRRVRWEPGGAEGVGPAGGGAFDAEAARAAFREGKVALLIDRAERAALVEAASGQADRRGSVAGLRAGVYEPSRKSGKTPGRVAEPAPSYLPLRRRLARRGGGRSAGAALAEAAIDFAKYLINPETANRVRSDRLPDAPGPRLARGAGLPDLSRAPGVESRPWADAVSQDPVAPRVVPGPADPAGRRLSRRPVQGPGGGTRGATGAGIAARGRPRRGRPDQGARDRAEAWHYRRSLNILVTTPRPPTARAVDPARA